MMPLMRSVWNPALDGSKRGSLRSRRGVLLLALVVVALTGCGGSLTARQTQVEAPGVLRVEVLKAEGTRSG